MGSQLEERAPWAESDPVRFLLNFSVLPDFDPGHGLAKRRARNPPAGAKASGSYRNAQREGVIALSGGHLRFHAFYSPKCGDDVLQGIITGIGLLGGGVTGRCLPQIKST